ncbi:MAG: hypothetical protein JF593_08685 [Novosphingobium sp.]|nr:hypothetical protein [Novosphingobium sp.]
MDLPGSYRSKDGQIRPIFYSELSTRGCRMTGSECTAEKGDVIQLALGPLVPAEGTVVWVNGQTAGVEFRYPLEKAVVEFFSSCLQRA